MHPIPPWQPPPYEAPPGPVAAGPVSAQAAIGAVWRDPNRNNNLLCAFLLILIPILGPIVAGGWYCEYHQRLVRHHPAPLPKFDFADFSHYLGRGVAPFVVQLVLLLPTIFVSYVLVFAVAFGAGMVGAALRSSLLSIVGQIAGFSLFAVVMLLMAVVLNAGLTRAELTEDIGQALQIDALGRYVRDTWSVTLVKTIAMAFVAIGLAIVGMLACCVGMYVAMALMQLAVVHLRWQIYNDYLAKGGAPISLKGVQAVPSEARTRP